MTTTQTAATETAAALATETERRWLLPASAESIVRERIERVNKRISREGLAPYRLVIDAADPVPVFDDHHSNGVREIDGLQWPTRDGVPCTLLYWQDRITVTVAGDVPCFAGWQFVATLENDPHAGTLTRVVPGLDVNLDLLRARDASECDHCQRDRMRRKVYALRSTETGELKQVGSTCLSAFLGIQVSITDAAFIRVDDDEFSDLSGGYADIDRSFESLDVLAIAVHVVGLRGWVSKSAQGSANGPATSSIVGDVLWPPNTFAAREAARNMRAAVTADDHETAAKVLNHARTLAGDGEYVKNLRQVATPDRVGFRNVALLVSAVSSYTREVERLYMERARQDSTHQGVKGERWQFRALTVVRIDAIDHGFRGTSYLVKLLDRDGNTFTWFASNAPGQRGDVVDVLATVKDHTEFRGSKETQITRGVVTSAAYGPALVHAPAKTATKAKAKRSAKTPAAAPAAEPPAAPATPVHADPAPGAYVSDWADLN